MTLWITTRRCLVLSIMPNRPVRGKWEYPRKMKRHYSMKQGYQIGIPLAIFFRFPHSLITTKTRFVKNGTENFSRNIAIEICGPPLEVIPNIPVGRKRSDQNFPNLWHYGKQPLFITLLMYHARWLT